MRNSSASSSSSIVISPPSPSPATSPRFHADGHARSRRRPACGPRGARAACGRGEDARVSGDVPRSHRRGSGRAHPAGRALAPDLGQRYGPRRALFPALTCCRARPRWLRSRSTSSPATPHRAGCNRAPARATAGSATTVTPGSPWCTARIRATSAGSRSSTVNATSPVRRRASGEPRPRERRELAQQEEDGCPQLRLVDGERSRRQGGDLVAGGRERRRDGPAGQRRLRLAARLEPVPATDEDAGVERRVDVEPGETAWSTPRRPGERAGGDEDPASTAIRAPCAWATSASSASGRRPP